MLNRILFKVGGGPSHPKLNLSLSPITIFVGPNNSGKSRALIEIEDFRNKAARPKSLLIVDDIEFTSLNDETMEREVEILRGMHERGKLDDDDDSVWVSNFSHKVFSARISSLLIQAKDPNDRRYFPGTYTSFLSLFTLRLDGATRLKLAADDVTGDLQKRPINFLASLFGDNASRLELRRIVYEAFGRYIVIDPTNVGRLRFRVSPRAPEDEREEKGIDSIAVKFHSAADLLSDCGDGVMAFVGILTAMFAAKPKITLIDEPEAFLHPALAAKLGNELASSRIGVDSRLFISTHSAAFLMGCVQAGVPLNIVRLTYDNSQATASLLATDRLVRLMRNPLLRSVGVLNALFYSAVVVAESDSDRAFYQEVNERLLAAKDPRGISGCLFLNAQNKQTVWDIVGPLRELGIPAVGVVDIDVIKEGGAVWQKPLAGAFIPEMSHTALQSSRIVLCKAFVDSGKDMKRDGGVYILDSAGQ